MSMQPDQLSSFLAMLWASGSALPGELCAASERLAAREIFEAKHTAKVALEPELNAAVNDPEITKIILTSDIIVMSDITVNRQSPLTLDLNGYKIASLRANASAIDLQTGELVITGQGSIVANGVGASGVRVKGAMTPENLHYASLIVDEQVTLYAPHAYGIYLTANFKAAYGVEIVLRGKIVARHGVGINRLVQGKGKHVPRITITDTAMIEVDADEGVALSAAGYAEWQVKAATITGATGASVKAGRLDFTNTKIIATGELTNPSGWDNSVGVGAVMQIEESSEYAGEINLSLTGGEYVSRQSYLVAKYGSASTLQSLEIKDGNFTVPSGVFYGIASGTTSQPIVSVSGGTFLTPSATELTDYLVKGFYLDVDRKTGAVSVIDPHPPEAEIDPVEQLALECAALERLVAEAKVYLDKDFVGDELGEWQDAANKAVAAIKRAVKAAEKLLQGSKEVALEPVQHLQKRLKTTIQGIEKIADEMRGEMLSVLTTAQELDPHEYSAYSYNALKEAIIAALALTAQPEASLNQLYSVFCDLQLNIDLLEEPENELDIALPEMPPAVLPILPSAPVAKPELAEPSLELLEPELAPIEKQNLAELGASVILATLDLAPAVVEAEVENKTEPEIDEVVAIEPEPAPVSVETEITMEDAPEPVDELALAAFDNARSSLYLMVEAVRDLALKDYQAEFAEQFGELQVAIVKAQAILQKPDAVLPEILDTMDELKFATAGLRLEEEPAPQAVTPETANSTNEVKRHTRLGAIALAAISKSTNPTNTANNTDWSALRDVVADIAKLEASDYTPATYANVLANLERAKTLLVDGTATQADADDLVFDLNLSMLALERNVQAPVSQQFMQPVTTEPASTLPTQADVFADQSVTPNLLMSMMAGAYAGLATYRKSRLAAKKRKTAHKTQLFSKV